MSERSTELTDRGSAEADSVYNKRWDRRDNRFISHLAHALRKTLESLQAGYDSNDMFNRQVGYCTNCNSNVVHVRAFDSRFAYRLDRMTLGILGLMRIGPWRCVDCGLRRMTLMTRRESVRSISDSIEQEPDEQLAVSNYLRTDMSLAHSSATSQRYSEKFRFGIVEKLLKGKSTVSQCCSDLQISELQLQMWIRDFVDYEIRKAEARSSGVMTVSQGEGANSASESSAAPDIGDVKRGVVIESSAVRKQQ